MNKLEKVGIKSFVGIFYSVDDMTPKDYSMTVLSDCQSGEKSIPISHSEDSLRYLKDMDYPLLMTVGGKGNSPSLIKVWGNESNKLICEALPVDITKGETVNSHINFPSIMSFSFAHPITAPKHPVVNPQSIEITGILNQRQRLECTYMKETLEDRRTIHLFIELTNDLRGATHFALKTKINSFTWDKTPPSSPDSPHLINYKLDFRNLDYVDIEDIYPGISKAISGQFFPHDEWKTINQSLAHKPRTFDSYHDLYQYYF